ncbi:hypothetical protein [Puniceibacterium sp. IMCC21224]|uniref:hypothetical protein n=1 Tax=Puniceibacterium sp. IMCC21224 TaxID=1618204 RepID=UPI00065D5BF5|nr:hypothetical protein [Puniceibacterium sp. IMCC21224]KMK67615.1 hypothetical protein IMCC21224_112486 [Puniceibacterium sp. IMCC21224]
MTTDIFVAGLAALTLIAALFYALTSKKRVDDMRAKEDSDTSSMAHEGRFWQ